MLILEYFSNGQCRVRLHKDWNPSRIGRAYMPAPRNFVASEDAYRLQSALLKPVKAKVSQGVKP